MAASASASTSNWWETWKHPPRRLAIVQVVVCILGNILGGSLLDKSEGFTNIPFAVGSTVSYLLAFYFMAIAMRTLPVSVTYPAQIGGVIAGTSLVGMTLYGEEVSFVKVVAILLCIGGSMLLEYTPEFKPGRLQEEFEAAQSSARGR